MTPERQTPERQTPEQQTPQQQTPQQQTPQHPTSEQLERAAAALRAGEVVAIPTDTVYGLAVDPSRDGATNLLFELKGRPRSLELPVLVSNVAQAEQLVPGGLPEIARRIADHFWPGAVTIVLQRRDDLAWDLGADSATIGIRCPAHPVPRWLCERVGPIATTSANLHRRPPLTDARAAERCFGARIALVVDGGPSAGSPSTVVDLTGDGIRCLREGAVALSHIEKALATAG
ncbi:MAG: L-threonylcarbamoyladenylate synthase [Acidimicrobiales bacterium]